MIKAVIFDCFGVIIADSLKVITDRVRASDLASARQIDDIIRANNRGLIEPAESNRQIADILGISTENFHDQVASGESKDELLMDYILDLRKSYKTAMLSNIGITSLRHRFSDEELEAHFDAVVVSGEIGYAKPEPEAYETTATRLGVRLDECVFTDDRQNFCDAAQAVGMTSIVYTSFDQFKSDLKELQSNVAFNRQVSPR